jgi:hypothetical protein
MKPVQSPIEKAVRPLKKDAIARAKQMAEERIEYIRTELAAAGGDINKAAPYPSRSDGGIRFESKRMRYNEFHSVTMQDPAHRPSYSSNQPSYKIMDDDKVTRFIQQRMEWAAEEYEAFVAKLVNKIGEVTKAKLYGNHVWGYSTLIVTMPDGEVQAWKTQQIVNYSKLGKPFNQWPTRRLKKVPDMKKAA